ncbi:MAG: hypothetical protein HQK76_02830 [Desulfobacterales bacterium]|nr:hypothetical protein [Desulfobacterales bacterium]
MQVKIEQNLMSIFSHEEIKTIISRLKDAASKGYIIPRTEHNISLMASFKGVEHKGVSPKWNVKIYSYNRGKNGHTIVCVDKLILDKLVNQEYEYFIPPKLKVLKIDDAGWGFPLCGIMIGVTDEKEIKTAVVPIKYFRHDTKSHFGTKQYLKKYTSLGIQLVEEFGASPDTYRIEICTGYVNQPLREKLRKLGYDVRVVEIKGMLQHQLENKFKDYIFMEVGEDIYYDPKDMEKKEIPIKYYDCLDFGWRYCPDKIKTGWNSIKGSNARCDLMIN